MFAFPVEHCKASNFQTYPISAARMTTQGRHVEDQAWVTLATNDTYGLGALVLARSLVRVVTARKLAILVTPGVTAAMRSHLGEVFDHVKEVNVLDSSDAANLALLTRPDLGITFTKLHCWRLTQFNKCVFMDADTLVLQNCDELFDREELSAAPDVGWPDCFNSGVFVYRPSNETYEALVQCALTIGSFDGGDQGLLNVYFRDWATKDINKHLPFVYNMTSSAAYSYLPAYLHFGKDVKVVHFIGPVKPWNHHYDTSTGKVDQHPGAFHLLDHLQIWWDIFVADVQPNLQPELRVETKPLEAVTGQAGLAMFLSQLSLGAALSPELKSQEDRARQFAWEQGHIDYMGADAFANIQRKLDENIVVLEEPTVNEPQAESTPSEELKSLPTESKPQAITDSSSTEPISVVSCPLAVPTAPVHRSSIHLSEPIKIPDKPSDAAAAAEAEPASSIPVSTRMEIIPAIPRTPPIVPSTPIMLPPPPGMSPVACPVAAPDTPSVTPATPGIPVCKTPTDSPSAVSAIPHPVSPIPSTPPAAGPVAQSKAITTSAPVAPTTTVPTTPPAIPVTAAAISPPPLPPRAPVPAPEAAAPSTPAKPAKKGSPEKPDVAAGPTAEAAPKPGAKKQQQTKGAAAAAAAAPAAPVRKGDKGKPSKK